MLLNALFKSLLLVGITLATSSVGAKSIEPPANELKPRIVVPKIISPDIVSDDTSAPDFVREGPTIQIALIIDTSNSMDGLIAAARTHLWRVVNELSLANKHNKSVKIQVGLIEYGKSTLPSYEGYLQILSPLTYELDSVSEALFSAHTNGGDEYAGKAIEEATRGMGWSSHPDDLKLIIIAGNESFQQGPMMYQDAISNAASKGIITNTVFCGPYDRGIRQYWKHGAQLGKGKYMNINPDKEIITIPTPFDDEITRLGEIIDETALALTETGKSKIERSDKLDELSLNMSKSVMADRAIYKSSSSDLSASWDVTALAENDFDTAVKEVMEFHDKEEMSESEASEMLKSRLETRLSAKKKLKTLQLQREKFLQEESKENESFGSVISDAIKEQASKSGFTFNSVN